MATLQQIEAEIARRQQLQQVEQQIAQKQPAGQVARQPGGVFQPEPTQPERGVMEILGVGAGERETRATQELPELGEGGLLAGEDMTKVAALTPVLLTTTKPEEIGQILSANFPNIGIQEDEKGNLIAGNNKTGAQVVINKPGISKLDVLQGLGIVAAFTPSARAATLGTETAKQATKGVVARRAAQGGLAAGTTEAALQTAQEATGGEFDVEDVAMATGAGALAETVVPAIQSIRQIRREKSFAKDIGQKRADLARARRDIAPAEEALEGIEQATGKKVGLFQAQKTLVPSELAKQRVLPQLDPSSRVAMDALEKQNKEVFEATSELINTVAPEERVAGAAARFRTAAQDARKALTDARSEAVSPLFKAAYDNAAEAGLKIDVKPVLDNIDELVSGTRKTDPIRKLLLGIKDDIQESSKTIFRGSNLKPLHNEKRAITQKLAKFENESGVLDREIKAKIQQIRGELSTTLRENSPAYTDAMEEFIRRTPEIEALDGSVLGRAAKVTDEQLQNLSSKIFNPRTTPAEINSTKKIVEQIDPQAWRDIVRNEIEFRVGSLQSQVTEQGADIAGNLPGAMRSALFGNPKQRETLLRALDADQRKNFVYMENILKRASAGRAAGSPTASFTEIIKNLRGRLGVLKDALLSPFDTAGEAINESLFNRRVSSLAEAMFDPQWKPQMKKLRKLSPNSPAAARAMTQLIKDIEAEDEE